MLKSATSRRLKINISQTPLWRHRGSSEGSPWKRSSSGGRAEVGRSFPEAEKGSFPSQKGAVVALFDLVGFLKI